MEKQRRIIMVFTITFLIIQSLTSIALVKDGKFNYVYEVVATTVLFISYIFLEARYNLYISNYVRGSIIMIIISHNLLGNYLNLYIVSSSFDKILHILGTYAFVLFTYSLLNHIIVGPFISKFREFIFIVFMGISIGVLFEIIEFFIDIIFKPKVSNQSSLLDTNLDLIFGVVGAIIAAIHLTYKNFNLTNNDKSGSRSAK